MYVLANLESIHGNLNPPNSRVKPSHPYSEINVLHTYCYENGNGVLKIINKSSINKNNGLVYMIN